MLGWLQRWLTREPPHIRRLAQPRVVLAEGCLQGITACLQGSLASCHEGVVYLLGTTDWGTTVAITAVRPAARTTSGSFEVGAIAMARVVRAAADLSVQVVGQVHTHPGLAAHSEGDVVGAKMKYPGYVSIVVPDYGRLLPALHGAAIYMYAETEGFVRLEPQAVLVAPGAWE